MNHGICDTILCDLQVNQAVIKEGYIMTIKEIIQNYDDIAIQQFLLAIELDIQCPSMAPVVVWEREGQFFCQSYLSDTGGLYGHEYYIDPETEQLKQL